ncbi:MAG TPA: PIG-L deacetylase family protein [Isosphaeraceae bacterium]|jgi:LmbE family N-acetylglucosaminyl deacetylase|nr:PIG-L deacetylase family protein [Isosphaeraceae bacterium]
MATSPRLLVIGAHPDDAEYKAGGLAALYRQAGCDVRFLVLTNGGAGHHREYGASLAARRAVEATTATAALGISCEIWDEPDGRLEPTLVCRERLIRAIRFYRPDLVLTHRPCDYHADHRATSLLVQDAAYLLTVPAICPDAPHLPLDPVIAYLSDDFSRPYPFQPTVIVDIAQVWQTKIALLHAHRSQFYEWLPYNGCYAGQVPETEDAQREWLASRMSGLSRRLADRFRERLVEAYGPERGAAAEHVEAFEACEYGALLDHRALQRLFLGVPMLSG